MKDINTYIREGFYKNVGAESHDQHIKAIRKILRGYVHDLDKWWATTYHHKGVHNEYDIGDLAADKIADYLRGIKGEFAIQYHTVPECVTTIAHHNKSVEWIYKYFDTETKKTRTEHLDGPSWVASIMIEDVMNGDYIDAICKSMKAIVFEEE